jgi:signal peptidase I
MNPKLQNRIVHSVIGLVVLVVIGIIVTRTFLYDFHRVPSASMYPTIPEDSLIVVKKSGYGHYSLLGVEILRRPMTASVERGDILIHQIPEDRATLYVKRVIGLPGDSIEYTGNRLTINGTPVARTKERVEGSMTYVTETIGDANATIAWDNNGFGKDYSIVVPEGHYIVFGDNRNNARDSRFIGPISRELIVGRVIKIIPLAN